MEIKIGFTDGARELGLTSSESQDDVVASITAAMNSGDPVITLTDEKGQIVVAKTANIAWVSVGTSTPHRVGFNIGN